MTKLHRYFTKAKLLKRPVQTGPVLLLLLFIGACTFWTTSDERPEEEANESGFFSQAQNQIEELVEQVIIVTPRPMLTPVAIAVQSQTATPTFTPTPSPTFTATPTLTPTLTITPTAVANNAAVSSPTPVATSKPPATPRPTSIPPQPTATSIPPEPSPPPPGGGPPTDPKKPNLAFSSVSYSQLEGDPPGTVDAVITVTLSFPINEAVTVRYQTNEETAIAGVDYVPIVTLPTLTFAPGQRIKSFPVKIIGDRLDEENETIRLFLSRPSSNANLTRNSATLRIIDNDPLPQVFFNPANYTITEGLIGTITLQLNTPSGKLVEVWYNSVDGTAISNSPYLDYNPINSTPPATPPSSNYGYRAFNPGETTKTFTLSTNDDSRDEFDEDLQLQIINLENALPGRPATSTVVILDNDDPPRVGISNAVVLREDGSDNPPPPAQAGFTITLLEPSEKPVTVTYTTAPDATGLHPATPDVDFVSTGGTVTFAPFPTIDQTRPLTVTIIDDPYDEFDETFLVNLAAVTNATVITPNGIGTIINTPLDDPPPTISINNASVVEGDTGSTNLLFTATLSISSERQIDVTFATEDGTATVADSDYTPVNTTLTFLPGQITQTATVAANGDLKNEYPSEFFTVTLTPTLASAGRVVIGGLGTGTITDDDRANLELTKTHTPPPVIAGTSITYTLTVTNTGPTKATNLVITDTLPPGLTVTNASPQCGNTGSTVVCNIGDLPLVGNSTTVTLSTAISPQIRGLLINSATVRASEPDPNLVNNNAVSLAAVVGQVEQIITKLDSPDPVIAGNLLTYTLTVTNNGPSTANNVTIQDTLNLPAGVSLNTSSPECGAISGTEVRCRVGTLAVSQTRQVTITLAVGQNTAQGAVISNTASVSATEQPLPVSIGALVTTTVNRQINLSVSKSANPSLAVAGLPLTYTITVFNGGPSQASGLVVADTLPVSVTLGSSVPSPGGSCLGSVCSFATLNAGSTHTVTMVVTPISAGEIVNTVAVTANELNLGGNSAAVTTTVEAINLSLGKTVDNTTPNVNDMITFTVTVSNTGAANATGVEVSDSLPAGLSYVSNSASQGVYSDTSGIWTVGAINSGASTSLQLAAVVNSSNPLTNTAEVIAADQIDENSTPGNGLESEDDQDSVGIRPQQANLGVDKQVVPTNPFETDLVTYTVTVSNVGPNIAQNVFISDTLPLSLSFISADTTGNSYTAATGAWDVGDVPVNGNRALTITARVAAGAGGTSITNTAQISTADQFDPQNNNNLAEVAIVPVLLFGPTSLAITGPAASQLDTSTQFTATVNPLSSTLPVTYSWQADDQAPVVRAGQSSLTDTVSFTWTSDGTKLITVTVSNRAGVVTGTHSVFVNQPPQSVVVSNTNTITSVTSFTYTFVASVLPLTTTLPITYQWQATDQTPGVPTSTNMVTFVWDITLSGTKTITVTATNIAGSIVGTSTVTVVTATTSSLISLIMDLDGASIKEQQKLYLPIIVKQTE